jgi:hypothetical protein
MKWATYVGGYYSKAKFIEESQRLGVSRRAPASVVKQMCFGDTVAVLDWQRGEPVGFAEFVITGLVLPHQIAEQVTEILEAEGKVKSKSKSEGGSTIVRECGTYDIGGSYEVTADIGEITYLAEQEAEVAQVPLDILVQGQLTRIVDPPEMMPDGYPFYRGFARWSAAVPKDIDGTVAGQVGYKQRETKKRKDLQPALTI